MKVGNGNNIRLSIDTDTDTAHVFPRMIHIYILSDGKISLEEFKVGVAVHPQLVEMFLAPAGPGSILASAAGGAGGAGGEGKAE